MTKSQLSMLAVEVERVYGEMAKEEQRKAGKIVGQMTKEDFGKNKLEEKVPQAKDGEKPERQYLKCKVCGDMFDGDMGHLWHCPVCDHHWPHGLYSMCKNCDAEESAEHDTITISKEEFLNRINELKKRELQSRDKAAKAVGVSGKMVSMAKAVAIS
ncbi:MAG: hypothetical protein RBT11_14710 [Desulfobacterales bacterium]|jgi:hypothetical protein|nr:hypothetical protein [Desulfobacterales bacterium]